MAELSPLGKALRRRFRSLDEALTVLGIDPYIMDQQKEAKVINFDDLPKDVRDARFSMRTRTGKKVYLALDDQGEEQDKMSRWLDHFKRLMHPDDFRELRELLAPYMHSEQGEDEPPPFSGRPRPGGEISPEAGTDQPGEQWRARDRRGRARDDRSGYEANQFGQRALRQGEETVSGLDRRPRAAMDQRRLAQDAGAPDILECFPFLRRIG